MQQNKPVPRRAACALPLLQGRDGVLVQDPAPRLKGNMPPRDSPSSVPMHCNEICNPVYVKGQLGRQNFLKKLQRSVGPALSMQEMCPAEVSISQAAKGSPSSALHIWTLKMYKIVISPRQGNHSRPDEHLDQSHKAKSTVRMRKTIGKASTK